MQEFHLRMQLAALRQYLRDRQDSMTQKELDEVLDLIAVIQEALNEGGKNNAD
ncbi:hypothetical protein SAMN04487996_13731 [Dyadobacter soli]|uniref:Uncharacterized protein n=1 Tax=Dyadobacter soli TaxID=659014 RepID=A0A1G8CEJ4_9BACT|nr:hypothetical protein [Dyadobacter soli]SDH43759.1 hypothetical protein SAMN04487996_13731 [Dyadobacter soli]